MNSAAFELVDKERGEMAHERVWLCEDKLCLDGTHGEKEIHNDFIEVLDFLVHHVEPLFHKLGFRELSVAAPCALEGFLQELNVNRNRA